ncbi:unnamed protein product [Cylicocyclus nassatus]|uniref:Uncharacterized protein n=1 Tax=Cylicocyclus nassatus TaxID=53992 RepID=A0AA36GPC6_CYLNA|nr:unnamed protein product [Cylicocyclus nassatus]
MSNHTTQYPPAPPAYSPYGAQHPPPAYVNASSAPVVYQPPYPGGGYPPQGHQYPQHVPPQPYGAPPHVHVPPAYPGGGYPPQGHQYPQHVPPQPYGAPPHVHVPPPVDRSTQLSAKMSYSNQCPSKLPSGPQELPYQEYQPEPTHNEFRPEQTPPMTHQAPIVQPVIVKEVHHFEEPHHEEHEKHGILHKITHPFSSDK